MTFEQVHNLRAGDRVRGPWNVADPTEIVASINYLYRPDDPTIYFESGGFWRSSALSLEMPAGFNINGAD